MKDIRLILVASFLVYFSAFAFVGASASEGEEEGEREHVRVVATGSINSSHRSEKAKERLERVREEQKKKLERIKEEQKKRFEKLKEEQKKRFEKNKKNGTGSTIGTGTTQKPKTNTGTVSGGTTTSPVTNTGTTTTAPTTKSQTVSYGTPDGNVTIGFSVTTNNGVITAASSTTMVGGTSGYYQNVFAAGLSQAVVGKKVTGLSLSAIGGASLTTNAFVKFVTQ